MSSDSIGEVQARFSVVEEDHDVPETVTLEVGTLLEGYRLA